MIREIMRDEAFLAQKAEPATRSDLSVAQDLLDTLEANKEHCVGMAANMIGVNSGSRPSPAGRRRSSSTRQTIARGLSFKERRTGNEKHSRHSGRRAPKGQHRSAH